MRILSEKSQDDKRSYCDSSTIAAEVVAAVEVVGQSASCPGP